MGTKTELSRTRTLEQRVLDLADELERRADMFRDYGAPVAQSLDHTAREIRALHAEWDCEYVSLSDAARISRYSKDTIGRHVNKDEIRSIRGPRGARLARLSDLPRKSGGAGKSEPDAIRYFVDDLVDEDGS